MKKISSSFTYFNKRVLPAIWFGFLGIFMLLSIGTALFDADKPDLFSIIMPIIMGVMGYYVMKHLVFDLMDEVYDAGDFLIFRNAGKEEQINFKDIKNISYAIVMNPPRVTLSLRRETAFGNEIAFCPRVSLIPFKKNRDIEELIDRVDKARAHND